MTIEAFPLQWPAGKPRVKRRARSRFAVTFGKSLMAVQKEVRLLGGRGLVISSNVELRRDGLPYASAREPSDPGVAVYFQYKDRPMCFACDRWDLVRDNCWAIAKTIEALRGIERWGTGDMVEQAFTGFTALPSPSQADDWRTTLGFAPTDRPTLEQVDEAYRRLAMLHHPDRGGSTEQFQRINRAREQAREALA